VQDLKHPLPRNQQGRKPLILILERKEKYFEIRSTEVEASLVQAQTATKANGTARFIDGVPLHPYTRTRCGVDWLVQQFPSLLQNDACQLVSYFSTHC
jgi:hypothetical protein